MVIDFTGFKKLINEAFLDFFSDRTSRVKISYGGSGSGKSFSSFQEILYKILTEPGHNYLICRKIHATNKLSTYALINQLINELNLSSAFKVNKSDMTITVKETGYMIAFKGLDNIEKIKSFTFPKGILTDIVVEEASEISQKDFDQLNARLRGIRKGNQKNINFQIVMLLNPIIDTHWIKREFIDKKSYQRDKEKDDGTITKGISVRLLHTTYLDNKFIDEDYKATLEGYKEIDYEFYRVYCLGEWGSFGNIIFSNYTFERVDRKEEDYDAVYYGQDFGYNHPNVISKIGFKDGTMYSFDELCLFEKNTSEIINESEEIKFIENKRKQMICDSAEPGTIKEWQNRGYGATGAKKGKGSVNRGINFIKAQRWIIDDYRCPRLAQEVQTYHWKKIKIRGEAEEIVIDDPVELYDDAIKAHIYALEPLSRMEGKPSVLSGSKSDQKKSLIELKKEERKKRREVLKQQRKKLRKK